MHKSLFALALAAALMACNATDEDIQAPTVHEAMTEVIIPASEDFQGAALDIYDETGELNSSELTNDRWVALAKVASDVEQASAAIAEADVIEVADEGVVLGSNDQTARQVATLEDVRSFIASDEEGFRQEWRTFAAAAQAVSVAAEAREAAGFEEAALAFNEACTTCHDRFWHAPETSDPAAQGVGAID